MTAQSIISDQEAREIAKRAAGWLDENWSIMGDSFAREFEATGRIWPAFINQLGASIRDTDDEDVLALHAYALKHGPRGPVEGWTA